MAVPLWDSMNCAVGTAGQRMLSDSSRTSAAVSPPSRPWLGSPGPWRLAVPGPAQWQRKRRGSSGHPDGAVAVHLQAAISVWPQRRSCLEGAEVYLASLRGLRTKLTFIFAFGGAGLL
mmetsp:Transcript_120068/g.268339  ORF Transcript_120068/g.268339 Transcript_120068/m.268339 type:complete len:118 (+) Transcript_120068:1521-1874(+)